MRNTMKMTLTALASLALIPATTATAAYTVKSPHPATVTATTYYPSGAFSGAVDISSGQCNYWGVETGVVGSLYWSVVIGNGGVVCYANVGGNKNEAKHVWDDGWTFRLWHFIKTSDSYPRTCDRCEIGNEGGTGDATGPHTHLQYDKSGTKDTSWYGGYTIKGEEVDRTEILGVLD